MRRWDYIAREIAPLKKGHATTRENIQFHFLPLERTPEAMRAIGEVGLSTREACGNTVRKRHRLPLLGRLRRRAF